MDRPAELPLAFEQSPRAMAALEHLLANPDKVREHLMLAGGVCQGREMYAAAAAVLLAVDNFEKWGL